MQNELVIARKSLVKLLTSDDIKATVCYIFLLTPSSVGVV